MVGRTRSKVMPPSGADHETAGRSQRVGSGIEQGHRPLLTAPGRLLDRRGHAHRPCHRCPAGGCGHPRRETARRDLLQRQRRAIRLETVRRTLRRTRRDPLTRHGGTSADNAAAEAFKRQPPPTPEPAPQAPGSAPPRVWTHRGPRVRAAGAAPGPDRRIQPTQFLLGQDPRTQRPTGNAQVSSDALVRRPRCGPYKATASALNSSE